MEHGLDAVRVMTVHGAKGLEAPLVILPDAAQPPRKKDRLLWREDLFLWPLRRAFDCQAVQALRNERQELDAQEYRRLLYVAMTRAEDRLYLCGYGKTDKLPESSWYALLQDGLAERPGIVDITTPAGEGGLRLESGPEERAEIELAKAGETRPLPALPAWALADPAPEPLPPRPLSPSRPEDPEPAFPSPRQAQAGRAARRRGRLIHKLLEVLPDLAPEQRPAAARRLLAQPLYDLEKPAQEEILEATLGVLEDPRFAPLFGPGSRAEVPLSGLLGRGAEAKAITGQVDRLLVREDEVLVIDYKTNRPAPQREADVAPLYVRQMASYRAVLAEIYPGRAVRCALLWTEGPRIMQLSDSCLARWV
jgi:ATP-dependent helicase/nuclease subunit A